jgi:hypothetical protein
VPFRLVPPLREVLLRTRFVPCGSCLAACAVPGGQGRSRTTVSCVAGRGLSQVLWRAWISVQRNRGAPGIDQITLGHVEEYGVTRLLGELAAELGEGRYRPLRARRVFIPKPGTSDNCLGVLGQLRQGRIERRDVMYRWWCWSQRCPRGARRPPVPPCRSHRDRHCPAVADAGGLREQDPIRRGKPMTRRPR